MNNKNEIARKGLWVLLFFVLALPKILPAQNNGATQAVRKLSLTEAVTLALKNGRDVLLAQTDVDRAAAAHREAQSPFRPELYLGSGLAYTYGYPLSIEGSAPSIFQISAQQALFNPALRNLEKQAGQMQVAAEKSLEQKQDDVVAQTALTYLDLVRSRRSLEYLTGYNQSLAAAEQIISERVQAGLDQPIEATRAKLNTAKAHSEAVGVQNQIAMLEYSLRDLTGIPQSQAIEVEPVEIPALPEGETLDQVVARSVVQNRGIQALEDEIRGKEFQVKSEQAAKWPRVNLAGQYGLFTDINNFSSYFRKFSRNNATLGFSVVVPLYNRFRTSALASKAEAELNASKLRFEDARAGVARQIRQLWGDTERQSADRDVARLELEVSRKTLDTVLAQFEEGRMNRLAVELARSAENQSWIHFYQASYDSEKARLELLRLSGNIRSLIR